MRTEWLKTKIDPSEFDALEKEHTHPCRFGKEFDFVEAQLPFGQNYLQWVEARQACENQLDPFLKVQYNLYFFTNGDAAFRCLAGREGYCVVRERTHLKDDDPLRFIIGSFVVVTRMS